jgi:TolB-like protein/Flp pilus assembly protein TadD
MKLAGPAEIVVSGPVRDELVDGLDAEIEDLGPCYVKHLEEPIRAYRVGPVGETPIVRPQRLDPKAAMMPSIAVIPFPVRVGASSDALLGEVVADDITAGLAKTARLRVTSRLSATALCQRHASPEQVGSILGVAYVMTGAVAVRGNRLLISVELADTRSGEIIWTDTLRSKLADLFSGAGETVATVVERTGSAILDAEMRRACSVSMPSLESYSLLLGAVALMHRSSSRGDFQRAFALLEQLTDRHRLQSAPHAWLAKWHLLNVVQGWTTDMRRDAQLALSESERALEQDARDPLALTIDGQIRGFLHKDLAAAETRHEQALAINPSEPMAWVHLANVRAWRGEGQFAEEATLKAIELSPLDPMKPYFESIAAAACLSAGQYARAIGLARRSLRGHRSHTATYRVLAISQVLSGDVDGATRTVAEMRALEPQLTVSRYRERYPGSAYAHADLYARALADAGLPA